MSTEEEYVVSSGTLQISQQDSLADILFHLSVNFLLYVVLIIVFYMLTKYYLEEDTTTEESAFYKEQMFRALSKKGKKAARTTQGGYALVSTEDEDEIELQNQQKIQQESQQQPKKDTLESLEIIPDDVSTLSNVSDHIHELPSKVPKNHISNLFNIHDWGEPEGTKQEVMQRLAFCSAGLIVSFCLWGIVQERILTQQYDGDFFLNSYGLVFMNRLGGLLLSCFLMWYFDIEWFPSILWEYSFPSVANMLSSWCQYEALKYVSFPVVMLTKAFKILPTLLMGKLLLNKSYETYEYVTAATVGFGLFVFIYSSEHVSFITNIFGDPSTMRGAVNGIVLLLLFLTFDSFTGQWQTRMFSLNRQLSPIQMMLIMNGFSTLFSFITLIHEEQLNSAFEFVYQHPQMIIHLAVFCLCSTIGQLFIFYTVKHFGAVVFSVIMSIRILFSTLLSCLVYSHPINDLGYIGILVVFGATAYRIHRKTQGQSLIRWKEAQTQQSETIFKEWHEHLDI